MKHSCEKDSRSFPNSRPCRSPAPPPPQRNPLHSSTPIRLTLAALLLLTTGCRHHGFPTAPDGYHEYAYVANTGSNTVSILDLVAVRPDRTLQVGVAPIALVANPRLDEIYVLNAEKGDAPGSVSVIDTLTNTVAATIPVERAPTSMAIDPAGLRAYVTNRASNTISVLDLVKHRVLVTESAGSRPTGAALSPDGRTLIVTHAEDSNSVSLFAVDPAGGRALSLRATIPGCAGATSPVILPDSQKAFIACPGSNQVLAIQLAVAPDSWEAKQDASLLTAHASALLDVGQKPTHLTMKRDGGEIFVSNSTSDSISEISTTTNEVGSTYPIGNQPGQGIVSQTGGSLWIPNEGADSISLYSIDDGRMVASLHAGDGPVALAFCKDEHLLLAADSRSNDVALIRTTSRQGPATLFSILPAGQNPTAILTHATQSKP